MNNFDTLAKYLRRNFQTWGDQEIAIRKKKYGIWNEYTWKDHYEIIKYFCLWFTSVGLKSETKVSILGHADPEWVWAQMATWSAGGIIAGIFTDALPHEVQYIMENSDSEFLLAHDQEQVDKILEIKDQLPLLKKIIYWDPKGLYEYNDDDLVYFNDAIEIGKSIADEKPDYFEELISRGKGSDIAMFYYTSGTTGLPKGAIITHQAIINTMKCANEILPTRLRDNYLSIWPPAWLAAIMMESGHLLNGMVINYPENSDTVAEDLYEISPALAGGGPRYWEGLVSLIQSKITDANIINRLLYNIFLPIGYKVSGFNLQGKKAPLGWRLLNNLGEFLTFRPLRNQLGFRNSRYFLSGSAAISRDTFCYFHAIGCHLRQTYGSTEAGTVCGHSGDKLDIRFETIGVPASGVEVKISEDGEILVRSPNMFSGYYKNKAALEEAMIDGWYHTGDAGYLSDEGHVIYIDRVKELGRLANGSHYSPQHIEGSFRFSPYIKDAVVVGGEKRNYLTAIINIAFDNVGRWAEKTHIPYTTYADLSQKERVAKLIMKDVNRVNKALPKETRIYKFALLHKEIDADEAELTRTAKLRRKVFEEKYSDLIEGLYGDVTSISVNARVTYRDGRKGSVVTKLIIRQSDTGNMK